MPKNPVRLNIVAALSFAAGLITLGSTLIAVVHLHRARLALADAHLTVIAGLSLLYLAANLRRGKRNAWWISLGAFAFLLARNFDHFVLSIGNHNRPLLALLNLLVPATALVLLVGGKSSFNVRSEIDSFKLAMRRSAIVLAAAFLYGLIGFQFFDDRDFHQEIPIPTAAHYVVDQLDLTTNQTLVAHTRRAVFFVDSMAAVSITALFYTAVSFFAPIRFRLHSSYNDAATVRQLLLTHSKTSEDFFKLWPKDKNYFFSPGKDAVIAYRTVAGVALAVGDPTGDPGSFQALITNFSDRCRLNGWQAAFIHTDPTHLALYESLGFETQKVGEEALLKLEKFANVATNKYFRNITNRFAKLGYRAETADPPHPPDLIARLRQISDDWLKAPGRTERTFMLGHFDPEYLNSCRLIIARDSQGLIQGFVNLLPSFNKREATFDLLRHSASSPGNLNDFLLMALADELIRAGFERLNLGLSPLSGLSRADSEKKNLISSVLGFVFNNAGRLYSFSGLRRFKNKYEPTWEGRYVVYQGGLPGFSKTMAALIRALSR